MRKYALVRKRTRGRGLFHTLAKKANAWLKKYKPISRGIKFFSPLIPSAYSGLADAAHDFAQSQGYGRRRKSSYGGALHTAGKGLRSAGMSRRYGRGVISMV